MNGIVAIVLSLCLSVGLMAVPPSAAAQAVERVPAEAEPLRTSLPEVSGDPFSDALGGRRGGSKCHSDRAQHQRLRRGKLPERQAQAARLLPDKETLRKRQGFEPMC